MNFIEIKAQIKHLLATPNPNAGDWADLMASLQFLLSDATDQALSREVIAMKAFKTIRVEAETKADAEISWKASSEWEEWRRAEEIKKEIEGWKTVCSRQTSARYKGY